MRRSQSSEEADDESTGWIDRMRDNAPEPTHDETKTFFGRTSGSQVDPAADNSQRVVDRVRRRSTEPTSKASDSWFGRARAAYGLGALLVAAGLVLFLFPEPITSTAGLVLIGAGGVLWLLG